MMKSCGYTKSYAIIILGIWLQALTHLFVCLSFFFNENFSVISLAYESVENCDAILGIILKLAHNMPAISGFLVLGSVGQLSQPV